LQIGVDPLHAGVHVSSQLVWQTSTLLLVDVQAPPSGQPDSPHHFAHLPLRQAEPSPHSQSLPHPPQRPAASTHALLFGLQAFPSGQPAVTHPSQRYDPGVHAPETQVQPVSQSLFDPHGGRHALPDRIGAHFQPAPQSAAAVHVSQAFAVGPVRGSHFFVVGLHWPPGAHPLTVQSCELHSVPAQGRQVPLSQTSEPPHGLLSEQLTGAPQVPFWQTSPTGH